MPVTIGVGVAGLGLEAYKLLHASHQEKEDKKKQENMKRPFEQIPPEYYQSENLAEQQASTGFSGTQDFDFFKNLKEGFGGSVSGTINNTNDPNAINKLFQSYGESVGGYKAREGQQQQENVKALINEKKDLAGQKTTAWAVNELQPYEEKVKQINERLGADEQNKWNAAQGAVSVLSSTAVGLSNSQLLQKTNPTQPGTYGGKDNALPDYTALDYKPADVNTGYQPTNADTPAVTGPKVSDTLGAQPLNI